MVVPRRGMPKLGWGSSAVECRTYGAQISLPQYPSPSGLGSRLAAGPPGLDALLGRTCPFFRGKPPPNSSSPSMRRSRNELIWTSLKFNRPRGTRFRDDPSHAGREESIPRRLKPNSLNNSYVRPKQAAEKRRTASEDRTL